MPARAAALETSRAGRLLSTGASVVGRTIASWFGAPSYKYIRTDANHADLAELRAAVEAGHVRAVVDKTFDFTAEGAISAPLSVRGRRR
jgi:hypothetical protein